MASPLPGRPAHVEDGGGVPREVPFGASALLLLMVASGGLLMLMVRLDREAHEA